MRIDDELKILAIKTGMTVTEIGRRMDKAPQAFSQKIKRGTFTLDDLQEIAMVTGSRLTCRSEAQKQFQSFGSRLILFMDG